MPGFWAGGGGGHRFQQDLVSGLEELLAERGGGQSRPQHLATPTLGRSLGREKRLPGPGPLGGW